MSKRATATAIFLVMLAFSSGCASTGKSPSYEGKTLGAGFRYSTYGPGYDPGPAYWVKVGQEMAARFPGSKPEAIWIVGNLGGEGTVLTFPGEFENPLIHYTLKDNNEEFLAQFDKIGGRVWLQIEPGNAPVEELIDIILKRYGHHPSVIGVGIDVEWYKSVAQPEGNPVSDEEARAWLGAIRKHDRRYWLFLKHWEIAWMPPSARDGILFVDDSQEFGSLDEMVTEFAAWGRAFEPAPVAFQFGYPADQSWWREMKDPPAEIGQRILESVPNARGLYWVDFTVRRVFPETE